MPGLYIREYLNAEGGKTKAYYGRIKPKIGGGRIEFALGSDERKAVDRWTEIRTANRRADDLSRFKPDKSVTRTKPETRVMTFAQWANEYPLQQEVKDKRSLDADLGMIRLHLEPFFGMTPLTGISRKQLI